MATSGHDAAASAKASAPVAGQVHRQPVRLQAPPQRATDLRFVIDDQRPGHPLLSAAEGPT